jgi:hypothetical protein
MLFKNVYNTMRVAPIMEAMPNSSFLVCLRDPVDIAQSILKGRESVHGNKAKWWALPPKEIDRLKSLPYWQQVVYQVYFIHRQIEEDRRRYGSEQFHNVNYDGLCRDTHQSLSAVRGFLTRRGITLSDRFEVPASFPFSTGVKVAAEDYQRIQEATNEIWGEGQWT